MNGVDMVVHAAALKQVTTAEYNPIEPVRTNIDGAINVIEAAIDDDVQKIVDMSTDKAVHPGDYRHFRSKRFAPICRVR